ncbi:hypothetical protein K440DRAFT_326700 [Wilcoxina mikolae CBS 423.85]|nr:hypothetical protein K440DRAFT_326700 [Wilcoxina mikolae CBS 423.85]
MKEKKPPQHVWLAQYIYPIHPAPPRPPKPYFPNPVPNPQPKATEPYIIPTIAKHLNQAIVEQKKRSKEQKNNHADAITKQTQRTHKKKPQINSPPFFSLPCDML